MAEKAFQRPGAGSGQGEAAARPRAAVHRAASGADRSPAAAQPRIGNAALARMLNQARDRPGAGDGPQQAAPAPVQRSTVHDVLSGPGQPLATPVKEEMEGRLGADFSDVRAHTDGAARASAAELGARAYTSGSHVVIGDGGADKHTLAHELTHVLQQRQGPVAGTGHGSGLKVSDPSDRDERAAEANAARVMRGPLSQHRQPSASPRPVGKTIIQRMFDKDGRTILNDLHSLNTALRGLTPDISGVSLDMFETPGASRLFLDQAIRRNNSTQLYDGMKRLEILKALMPELRLLVNNQQATFTYDRHGDKHFPGGDPGTKFTGGAAVVNPELEGIIQPLVGRIRRDARGAKANYYLTQAGIRQCPRGYDLTIQITFDPASDEITYHGYPDDNVRVHSLSQTKGGSAIPL